MSRKKIKVNKKTFPDPIYNNKSINKLINYTMKNGKKNIAYKIVYGAIEKLVHEKEKSNINIFKKAIKNIMPNTEVKSRKIGGATYQIPMEINKKRSLSLSLKWIIKYSKIRKTEKGMVLKLKNEIIDAYNKRGGAYKRKEEIHRIAESNRAFSHYKW